MSASSGRTPANGRVLLVNVTSMEFGGQENHVLTLFDELTARGHEPELLVLKGSIMQRRVAAAGRRCHAVPKYRIPGYFRILDGALTFVLAWLCHRYKIDVIHCNNRFEIRSARRVARLLGVRTILNYHVADEFDVSILKGVHAFVSPSQQVVEYVENQNRSRHLGLSKVVQLPPLFDQRPFTAFETSADRNVWFSEVLGIRLRECPVVCTIGNMVADLQTKNYPLLFRALSTLIHGRRMPVQAVLVGDGAARQALEQLARDLGIATWVHFVGFTIDHVPAILHFSDFLVLPSSTESFGLVFAEAALMRRAAVGSTRTGAEAIIVHNETGLLFERDDEGSLTDAIAGLVANPDLACRYGQNAYRHVRQVFATDPLVARYESLYDCRTPTIVETDGYGRANGEPSARRDLTRLRRL